MAIEYGENQQKKLSTKNYCETWQVYLFVFRIRLFRFLLTEKGLTAIRLWYLHLIQYFSFFWVIFLRKTIQNISHFWPFIWFRSVCRYYFICFRLHILFKFVSVFQQSHNPPLHPYISNVHKERPKNHNQFV